MALLGNVIWFIFGGLIMGLLWAAVGAIAFITVIGIPWGRHKRLTQEELAERMGVNRSTYAQMERSQKPHLATLEKAAAALQINLVHLVELYDD